MNFSGVKDPVAQVMDEATGELIYAVRRAVGSLQPKVLRERPHTVNLSKSGRGKLLKSLMPIDGLRSLRKIAFCSARPAFPILNRQPSSSMTRSMTRMILSLLLFTVFSPLASAAEGKHLFILSGQSNMNGLKPERSFIPEVEKAFGKEGVIVVKDAQNGSPIRNWYRDWKCPEGSKKPKVRKPFGHLYDQLMKKVRPAIEGQKLVSVTFVWMQGERDAMEGYSAAYAESFQGLLGQLKEDLKRDDVYFVLGRISDFGLQNEKLPDWAKVRDVQVKLAEEDPMGDWVDTDEFNGTSNRLHYSSAGYKAMGEAFAKKAIALING